MAVCPARPVYLVAPVAVPHILHPTRPRAPELRLLSPPESSAASFDSCLRTRHDLQPSIRHTNPIRPRTHSTPPGSRTAVASSHTSPHLVLPFATNYSSISGRSSLYPRLSFCYFIVLYRSEKRGYKIGQVQGGPLLDAQDVRELVSPRFDSQGRLTRQVRSSLTTNRFFCLIFWISF